MGALKSGLISIAAASLVATMAIVGCSADGSTGDIDPNQDQDPNEAKLPPKGEDPPMTDGGKKTDSGSKDSAVDTYVPPPPPNPGDPCTTVNQIVQKSCGKCGKADAICQASEAGLSWSTYGPCNNQMGLC